MENTTLHAPEDLLKNPVYISWCNLQDKARGKFDNIMKGIFDLLDRSIMAPPYFNNTVDIHSEDGDDVFHQYLDMYIKIRSGAKSVALNENDPLLSNYNKIAIRTFHKILNNEPVTEASAMGVICELIPVPYETCEYSRLTNKSLEYLVSLGRPSVDLIQEFYNHLNEKAKSCPHNNYEGLVVFKLDGKTNAIYYGVRNSYFYAIRYYAGRVSCDFCYEPVDKPHKHDEMHSTYEVSLEDDCDIFDARSLLANLWAAKETAMFSSSREPSENRNAMKAITGAHKTNFNSYYYVHITPDGEKAYDESKRIISQARGDCEYRKSVWFSRAYYAARGYDKKITFCKASIHHRKCAPVTPGSKPTMYT